ncbi:glutathione transferase [Malassezia japonica]|uniref:Glutathione transferase n=1 Tax=Malassezia japonica TaxID=223818 RepID=A0AAF0EWH4_9BASI|nr:glutathione transferase [Malassezia japonica]WFD38155.1 glutathione transferase [Malassezia japonica]
MAQFTLYILENSWGLNPIKIGIFLEELGLDYELKGLELNSTDKEKGVKGENYLAISPNGRTPTLVDHKNNDFTVWESGAILQYLQNKYDTSNKYGSKSVEEQAIIDEWLFFQVTGHSPVQGNLYFAKNSWKKTYGEDPPQNVIARFSTELHRVLNVYEKQLEKQAQKNGDDNAWLALDHPTIADFSALAWFSILPLRAEVLEVDLAKYPFISKYIAHGTQRPSFEAVRKQIIFK